MSKAIAELSIALEELQVAAEELQHQNEELNFTRQALELERQRYQELFEFAPDGYLVTNAQGAIREANYAVETLLNCRRDLIVGKPLIVFVAEADRKTFYAQLNRLSEVNPNSGGVLHLGSNDSLNPKLNDWELLLQPREREPFPAAIAVSKICDHQGELVGLRWLIRNLAERKRIEEQLRHNALHDSLTGLPNRTLLLDRLEHALQRYRRHPEQLFALLFLDLDRFKAINDSLGHLAGDQLLLETASRLQNCLRASDTVARLGGDEFVILLEDIGNLKDIEDCASRIQKALAAPLNLNGHQVAIAASIGIVLSDSVYQQAEELLRDADLAMYQAKQKGRACYQIFASQMHAKALSLLNLERELRQGIQRQEFQVHYQSIVSLADNRIAGFEALVRWQHPQRGLISPPEFLPVAEETGLILPIGWWVLEAACRQAVQWQAELALTPPLTVSVNLSNRQFAQPDMVAQVRAILQETGLDPRCLKLEITEGVIVEDVELAIAALVKLRELQVQLYIDDFGTGFSSLSRLRRLPIDALKIDRSFIGDREGFEIVRAIVTLAHNLGMDAIAEGVETAQQVEQLQSLRCEYAQGYFFGRPSPSQLTELKIS